MTTALFLFAVATVAGLYLAVQAVLGFDAARFDPPAPTSDDGRS